jgi:PilX N-terminal
MSKIKGCLKDDKGMALITVLLILVLLTTLGMYSIWTSNSETALGGNERLNKMAYYVAEAGLNEAETRLGQISGQPYYVPGSEKADIEANPSISWSYSGLVNVTNGFGSYSTYIYPTFENTWNGGYHNYTAFHTPANWLVLYNRAFRYPDSPVPGSPTIGFPVYHVISRGWIRDPGGRIISQAMLSADITENSINVQAPGGIYSGTSYTFNSAPSIDAGTDVAIVTGTNQDLSTEPGITGQRKSNSYTNMSSFLGLSVSQIKSLATETTCGANLPPYLGSYPNDPQIIFADNACKYCGGSPGQIMVNGNQTGSGILLITGDVKINGTLNFTGLVYVLGSLTITGTANIDGAIMVNGTSNTVIGGNCNITLDRTALEKVSRAGFSNKMIVWKDERQ